MSTQNLLPAIPQPPHDPTWWLLNSLVGWRAGSLLHVEPASVVQALMLTLLPGSGRSLTEPGGSFGGLVLPANVVLEPDGSLYLLDSAALELKRFDPCDCRFKTVPCFGGRGQGRRELLTPRGMSIHAGNLYICDSMNHRVSVFSLRGFIWRAAWRPPPSASLAQNWQPYAIAFDKQGRGFVSDPANGCIHRFSPTGRWETCLSGFGNVTYLTIDPQDRLYVAQDGVAGSILVIDTGGQPVMTAARPDEIASAFPSLPFQVDAQGNLALAACCPNLPAPRNARQAPPQGLFDLRGNPVLVAPQQSGPTYYKEGQYISEGLDSKLYQCQWHRVILCGQISNGARIVVSTYTAEALQSDDDIAGLPEAAWETNRAIFEMTQGQADCLVRNGGGRYLWLRLQLKGNGSVTPIIESIKVEFPRISLRRYLPAVFAEDPGGTRFTDRFLSIFDTTLRSIEHTIDTQARYFDPLATPATPDPKTGVDFLSWLASWIGVAFDRNWPEQKRRRLLKKAARLYEIRGTRQGLWQQLLLYLGMEANAICCSCDQPLDRCHPHPDPCAPIEQRGCAWQPPPLILEHYQLRRWLFLGAGRLGDQAVLWGQQVVNRSQLNRNAQVAQTQLIATQDPYRDPFHVYAYKFSVFVPASYGRSDQRRKALENLLNAERPAHTLAQVIFVEPRFRIGIQSMIGLDSAIGRYPEGVTLNATPLGQAAVLGEPPEKQGAPSFEVGRQSRIGATTRLE